MQVTSPIRRMADLINQTKLLVTLYSKEDLFSDDELLMWNKQLDDTVREYYQVDRLLTDHWKYKYLEQNQSDLFEIRLLRYLKNGKALVNLTKLDFTVEAALPNLTNEERYQVKIDRVAPDTHSLQLSLVETLEQETD